MELPIQIAAGAGVVTGAAFMAHFFYTAFSAPEHMNLGMASNRSHTAGSRTYLGMVALSWIAFAFSGAYGLLAWLPTEGAATGAVTVALLSLVLLNHLERAAYTTHALRRSQLILRELEGLIKYATIPSAGTIERHKEQAKDSEVRVEREAHEELARLAAMLAERDTKLCAYTVSQAIREVDERAQQQQKIQKLVQANAAKQARVRQFKQILDGSAAVFGSVLTLNSLKPGVPAVLESNVATPTWEALVAFSEGLLRFGTDAPIQKRLQAITGIRLREGVTFTLKLNGTQRDGYFDARAITFDTEEPIADGLEFEESVAGLVAAFFLRAALPGHLAWGHGRYDRDQQFVMTQEQAIAIIDDSQVDPENAELRNIRVPPGLRVGRKNGTLTLDCLTYLPGKGFYDTSVSLDHGRATISQETKLCQWGNGILY